jgi:hypothetical protein
MVTEDQVSELVSDVASEWLDGCYIGLPDGQQVRVSVARNSGELVLRVQERDPNYPGSYEGTGQLFRISVVAFKVAQ